MYTYVPLPPLKIDIAGQNCKKKGLNLNIKKEPLHTYSIQ